MARRHGLLPLAVAGCVFAICSDAAAQEIKPVITGEPVVGAKLTATHEPPPADSNATYQWLRCPPGELPDDDGPCTGIEGATLVEYTVRTDDVGFTLAIRLTVTSGDQPVPTFSDPTAVVPRWNRTPPAVTGMAQDGQVLRASRGEWDPPPEEFAFRWERCSASGQGCQAIEGAMSVEHVAVRADVGMTLRVCVTASNIGGSATACSERTAVVEPSPLVNLALPEIDGRPGVGASLTARPGRWSISEIDLLYRWLRCNADGSDCRAVPGALDATYEVRRVDVGFRLRVRVTAISDAGSLARESALTPVVPAPPGLGATPAFMRPFPKVRLRGHYTSQGAVLDLVLVTAPRRARVAVSCRRSTACPFRHRARSLTSRRLRLRGLERDFPAGARIEFRITKPNRIGKYTRVVIRAGDAPARRDRCLMPEGPRAFACKPG